MEPRLKPDAWAQGHVPVSALRVVGEETKGGRMVIPALGAGRSYPLGQHSDLVSHPLKHVHGGFNLFACVGGRHGRSKPRLPLWDGR